MLHMGFVSGSVLDCQCSIDERSSGGPADSASSHLVNINVRQLVSKHVMWKVVIHVCMEIMFKMTRNVSPSNLWTF